MIGKLLPPKKQERLPVLVEKSVPKVAGAPTREDFAKTILDMVSGMIPTRVGAWSKIRESSGYNRSPQIDTIIKTQGGSLGDPYCQWGQQEVADELCRYYKVDRKKVAIPEGGGTQDVFARTPSKYKRTSPLPGCWITWSYGNGKGHVGIVVKATQSDKQIITFEFNTGPSSAVERDGQGAYLKTRSVNGYGDAKVKGYIDLYQAMVDAMVVKTPAPTPSPSVDPSKPSAISLSWENTNSPHPERKAWTERLMMTIDTYWPVLSTAKDIKTFAPRFEKLPTATQKRVYGELLVGLAYYECGFNPKMASVDVGTENDKNTWSVGLFQMSVVDQKNWSLNFGLTYDDLLKPEGNIDLGLAVLKKQIEKRGLIVVPSTPYWATLYRGKYDHVDEIAARVKKFVPEAWA